jgi:hypothetical protein
MKEVDEKRISFFFPFYLFKLITGYVLHLNILETLVFSNLPADSRNTLKRWKDY